MEDWVPADHPAQFLREFVEQLDLSALGFEMPSAADGRPAYHPSLLLKIWLYGYFHRIWSTRKLEAACRQHMSLLWLTGMIAPEHNIVWRFWCHKKKALRALFKQTVQLAVRMGAVGFALQALRRHQDSGSVQWSQGLEQRTDGTDPACAGQLDGAAREIEGQVVEANPELDGLGYRLPGELSEPEALRQQIQQGLAQLQADRQQYYHPAELEARRMKVGDTNRFAYNAQAVADFKHGVIVACDVTRQETDTGQLVPMIKQAQQNLAGAPTQPLTVADAGYGSGADLQAAAEQQMAVLVPPAEGKPAAGNLYAAQHFH